MSTVLLTGASGFLGAPVTAALRALGHTVHAVSRRPPPSGDGGVVWHAADLLDPDDRARVVARSEATGLIHLAWVTEHGRYWHAPENDAWAEAGRDLVRRFAAAGGRRAVFAGTCAEYDWTDPALAQGFCSETGTPCRPVTPYGRAKLRLLRRLETETAVSWAWARLFFLYGPGEDGRRLVPSLAAALRRGAPACTGPGDLVRDFLHVDDAAAALAFLLDGPVEGPVNVASGEPVPIGTVAAILGELAGRPDLVRVGALPARAGDPPRLVADVARLRAGVGRWSRRDLRVGLAAVWAADPA